jgi:hypothetical protein
LEAATKSPQKPETRDLMPHPRVNEPTQCTRIEPIHTTKINNSIPTTLAPTKQKKSTAKEITPTRMELRERIRKHHEAKTMARIPQQSTYS